MTTTTDSSAKADLQNAEQRVVARSAVLRKELGLTDLALTQILFVVGLPWVGTAAKLGPAHIGLWLLAMLLFYLPSAVVVIYLTRLMPLEGGLYQWAKLGIDNRVGFMVAWNLWLYVIVLNSETGLQVATNLAYAIGPKADWIAGSRWFIGLVSCVVIIMLVVSSMRGLAVGKWVHNAGGVMILLIFAALIAAPLVNLARGTLTEYHPFTPAMPALTLFSLNILAKMGFGALGGFEYVAILAGECRDPIKTISRSVVVAAPIIAVMFILGTSSVLAFIRPVDIDLIGPIAQILSVGYKPFAFAATLVSTAILLLLGIRLAQASVNFTGNTRLPLVAGWDGMLPGWFTRLHSKYKTPVNSIIFVGALTLAFSLAGLIGVGHQEAFQVLWNMAGTFYALTYLVLFAIPIFGLRGVTPRPPFWVKLAAGSGLMMTILYVGLSIVPIINVSSRTTYAAKISAVIVVSNLIGVGILLAARRRGRFQTV